MKLFFRTWSQTPQESETLVFLHGLAGTSSLWRPLAVFLEKKYHVIAFDQRGHGKSQMNHENDYSPTAYGKDIVETLSFLHSPPVWLIGHSMGVRSALASALENPSYFKGIILIDLGLSGNLGGGMGMALKKFFYHLPTFFDSKKNAIDYLFLHAPEESMARYLIATLEEKNHVFSFPFDLMAIKETIESCLEINSRPLIEKLSTQNNIPFLILRGENSSVWTQDEYEKEKSFFKDKKNIHFFQVEKAGHGLPFEKRAVFLELLENFIFTYKK